MVLKGEHECDLFLLSSHHSYIADKILPAFALKGRRNIDGWGIGSYTDGTAHVVRTVDPVVKTSGALNREFAVVVEAVTSPVILGHLRLTSKGAIIPENNHPFKLDFLGYDWLIIHNGSARHHEQLVPFEQRLILESDSDTPRIFEFLRRHIIEYSESDDRKSLIEGCRRAFGQLLSADPQGTFNIILSNGYLSFVFIHWRPFYLLHREKHAGDVVVVTTIENLTSGEEWLEFKPKSGKKAKMLVFSGPSLIFNGDIPT